MSALVAAADRGDVAGVQRLLKEGASVSELDLRNGIRVSAMYMPVVKGDIPVVKCLIEEGGADINAMIGATAISPLSLATLRGKYSLAQWLIEEGAIIPTKNMGLRGKRG
jgi:hypothetical protein